MPLHSYEVMIHAHEQKDTSKLTKKGKKTPQLHEENHAPSHYMLTVSNYLFRQQNIHPPSSTNASPPHLLKPLPQTLVFNPLHFLHNSQMPGGNPTPLDLLRFHRPEREFFATLINRLGLDRDRMKWVMSLWLWLESIGHHDFIRRVSINADDVVLRFVAEAESCLARIADRHGAADDELIPLTASLMSEPIDLRFFEFHGNVAVAGVKRFYEKVACVVFDERAMEIAAAVFGEAGSSRGLVGPAAVGSRLNPMAEPWSPAMNHSPEDQRSMFITFSRGYPLTREEIAEFFNARFGKCVEMVMIERAGRSPPMYGRVVFTNASMIAIVLNGQQTAKFMIEGKHLWARIYVPRQHT